MVYAAGEDLSASELNVTHQIGRVVARGRRVTSSTAASAEQSVLRIDAVALTGGHAYWIGTNPVILDASVANDHGRIILRANSAGVATTASTTIALSQTRLGDIANGDSISAGTFYVPAGDESLSVLLSTARQAGTGNISITTGATFPIELFVIDCGEDPGDTGVDL